MDAALLARTHADGLAVLHIAHGVGLGVLEGDEGHDHVPLGCVGQVLVFRDQVGQQGLVDLEVVSPLLEGDAEHVLVLLHGGDVIGVDLDDVIVPLLLGLEDLQGLRGVVRGDDAVGNLRLEVSGGGGVAGVAQGRPVAVGAEAVRASGADVCTGQGGKLRGGIHKVNGLIRLAQGQAHGGPGGRDVLEGRGGGQAGGLLQLLDQLPGVQGVHKIDVARLAVQHF